MRVHYVAALSLVMLSCRAKPADDRPLPGDPTASGKVLRGELGLIKSGTRLGDPLRAPKVTLDAQNVSVNGFRVAARSALTPAGRAPESQSDVHTYAQGLRDHWKLLYPADAFDPRADVVVPADATFLEGASLVESLAEAGYASGLTLHAGDATVTLDVAALPPADGAAEAVLEMCNESGWQARVLSSSPPGSDPLEPFARDGVPDRQGPWRPISTDGIAGVAASLCATPCTGVAVSGGPASFHDSVALLAAALRSANVGADSKARFEACSPTSPASPVDQGIGGADPPAGNHHVDAPQMREGAVAVNGRLPPEVIQRIVRQHFGQLRLCYLNGLRTNAALAGRVSVRFLIDVTGAVSRAVDGGSDMPDRGVVACVVNAFATLSFPAPESGTVQVNYPLTFSPNPVGSPPSSNFAPAPSGIGLGLSGVGESGGCPCGCDHSVDMASELRHEDRDVALAAIDDSLRTIGAREDAGYVTERMIEHRLRLLDLGHELGREAVVRFTPVAPIHATRGGTTSQGTIVGAELFLHGETTEIVHGAEKLLRTSFVLRVEAENPRAAAITLHEPSISATVGLPVSRWYVAGGDGRPWDGVLHAGERTSLYVVGYAAEPVLPGTEIDATIHLESLDLPVTVRARKRWNEGS